MAKLSKLSVVEDLHKQYDIVRLHNWLRGHPEQFQQACLILRRDVKVELTPRVGEYGYVTFEEEGFFDERSVWAETTSDGGTKFFAGTDEVHELSHDAQEYVAKARTELGYLVRTSDEFDGSAETKSSGALVENNIRWNDMRSRKKSQVEEVLALALKLARADEKKGKK